MEHELTHVTTKRLAGKMRLNLNDELITDTLGMLKAIKIFFADLFRMGLGVNIDSTTKKRQQGLYTFKRNESAGSANCLQLSGTTDF